MPDINQEQELALQHLFSTGNIMEINKLLQTIAGGKREESRVSLGSYDLSGVTDLTGIDFSSKNIDGFNIAFTNARGVDFSRGNFEDVSLEGDYQGCKFDNTSFDGAILLDTKFQNASFKNASLQWIQAEGVDITGSDLEGANVGKLSGGSCHVIFGSGTSFKNASIASSLFGGRFTQVTDWEGVDLSGTDLLGNFSSNDLEWKRDKLTKRASTEFLTAWATQNPEKAEEYGIGDFIQVSQQISPEKIANPQPSQGGIDATFDASGHWRKIVTAMQTPLDVYTEMAAELGDGSKAENIKYQAVSDLLKEAPVGFLNETIQIPTNSNGIVLFEQVPVGIALAAAATAEMQRAAPSARTGGGFSVGSAESRVAQRIEQLMHENVANAQGVSVEELPGILAQSASDRKAKIAQIKNMLSPSQVDAPAPALEQTNSPTFNTVGHWALLRAAIQAPLGQGRSAEADKLQNIKALMDAASDDFFQKTIDRFADNPESASLTRSSVGVDLAMLVMQEKIDAATKAIDTSAAFGGTPELRVMNRIEELVNARVEKALGLESGRLQDLMQQETNISNKSRRGRTV